MGNIYLIGLDFGTDSVRALLVDAADGRELGSRVANYRRWSVGEYCDPARNQFRQHPLDYLEGMEEAVKGVLEGCGQEVRENIVGIGVDTTGSTPCAADDRGQPLALREEFKDNPNAMFVLWKDHTAVSEAEEINQLARNWGGVDYTRYEGGVYSTEWFWSKILHILREDGAVRGEAYTWIEHCDWIPAELTGTTAPSRMKRSRCAAGHKAMWNRDWNGLPGEEFLVKLDPLLKGLRERLYQETYTSDEKAGGLTAEWAERLGLKPGTAVAVGAFDAHMGAVGGGIRENTLVKIMGTSTCDVMVAGKGVIGDRVIPGICGQVDGSVIPGMIGLEAGQSAYGDVYAWFKDLLSWPLRLAQTSIGGGIRDREDRDRDGRDKNGRDKDGGDSSGRDRVLEEGLKNYLIELEDSILPALTAEAERLEIGETGLLALDWLNGRRTPFADQTLKGAVVGLSLGTSAPRFFRALVEATAYGARAINEQFIKEGVRIDEIIALGGISSKNDFVMQVTTDILNRPIKVAASEQACALGAAMFGAVAAGVYGDIQEAQEKMGPGFSKTYHPREANSSSYQELYELYRNLGENLGGILRSL